MPVRRTASRRWCALLCAAGLALGSGTPRLTHGSVPQRDVMARIDALGADMKAQKQDMKGMKQDMKGMKQDMKEVKQLVGSISETVGAMAQRDALLMVSGVQPPLRVKGAVDDAR